MDNTATAINCLVVTTAVTYTPERIPPRCRRPRPVREPFILTTKIPTVPGHHPPVAAVLPPKLQHRGVERRLKGGIRTYGGNLYASSRQSAQFTNRDENVWVTSKDEAGQSVAERFKTKAATCCRY